MTERKPKVLVVDDKLEMAEMVAEGLEEHGFVATATASPRKAFVLLGSREIDALVTDLRMPEIDGLRLLAVSREADPDRPVIIMTGFGAVDSAIESIRKGAFHYLTKPFKTEELVLFLQRGLEQGELRRETEALRRALRDGLPHPLLLGRSKAIRELIDNMARVADAATPVLVLGETGTGKSLVARALHEESSRKAGPFVTVNCAAIPEALLESELFGHVKGAFTGAVVAKPGLFVAAEGGTLLLDEIGDMPLGLQAKLLDVLSRGVVRPVGGTRERPINARIVAATHRHLREMVQKGTFREDLYFRLSVLTLEIPPLRRRVEDIPLLVTHYFESFKKQHPTSVAKKIEREALDQMLTYRWPGNVRELSHVIERAILLARGPSIAVGDLSADLLKGPHSSALSFGGQVLPLREVQRRYARWAFEELQRARSRTAERLDVDPKTLDKLLEEAIEHEVER